MSQRTDFSATDIAPSSKPDRCSDELCTDIWKEGSLAPYDLVPYSSHPFDQSHPDRLATIAHLLGMAAPAVETANVLELGCASGGNILPMAEQLPRSRLLGIDGSKRQIEIGLDSTRQAGLDNVELRHQNILDFDDVGPFDFIISHGVLSWVAPDVQERIFQIVAESLAPNGIAYISYNTYPGWHVRRMIRDIMLYRARSFDAPTEKLDTCNRGRGVARLSAS